MLFEKLFKKGKNQPDTSSVTKSDQQDIGWCSYLDDTCDEKADEPDYGEQCSLWTGAYMETENGLEWDGSQMEALILLELRRVFGFGEARLKRFYQHAHYILADVGEQQRAVEELKQLGIDLDIWAEEMEKEANEE